MNRESAALRLPVLGGWREGSGGSLSENCLKVQQNDPTGGGLFSQCEVSLQWQKGQSPLTVRVQKVVRVEMCSGLCKDRTLSWYGHQW